MSWQPGERFLGAFACKRLGEGGLGRLGIGRRFRPPVQKGRFKLAIGCLMAVQLLIARGREGATPWEPAPSEEQKWSSRRVQRAE